MNLSMWSKALQGIPRVSKDEWLRLDVVSKWLIASRAGVLVITFISAGIAGLMAFRDGQFSWGPWLLLTFGLLMAHATNNLLNDMTDYSKGLDHGNYFRAQYGVHPLEHGLLTMRQMWGYVAITGLLAVVAGAYLVYLRGAVALLLMGLGAFFVLFYTFPLKYIGLGEVAVLLVWGPLMIGGGYYVVTGLWSWNVVLAGLPYAVGATTVIFGKHIDKFEGDKAKGVRTLPVLLGERAARYTVLGMMALQYLLVLYLIVTGFLTIVPLIVLFALPTLRLVAQVYGQPRPASPPPDYPAGAWPLWFVAFAFFHNRRFGMLFLLGLVGDLVLKGVLALLG